MIKNNGLSGGMSFAIVKHYEDIVLKRPEDSFVRPGRTLERIVIHKHRPAAPNTCRNIYLTK
jgi:hypothetical protein